MKQLFISLLIVSFVISCQNKKAAVDTQQMDQVDLDTMSPNSLVADFVFESLNTEGDTSTLVAKLQQVKQRGRTAPDLASDTEMSFKVSESLIKEAKLSEMKSGDTFTAMIEFVKRPNLGQASDLNNWNLVSIN